MKKIAPFILFSLLLNFCSQGQDVNWQWARASGFAGVQEGVAAAADTAGNVFITGFYQLGPIGFDTATLFLNAGTDIFVVKYSATGNVMWAKSAVVSGQEHIETTAITTDISGNAYITGFYSGDSVQLGSILLPSPSRTGRRNFFIAKYSATGTVLWVKVSGAPSFDDAGYGITADALGYIYVTGYFGGDSMRLDNFVLNNPEPNYQNSFIAKFDTSGHCIWARCAAFPGVGSVWARAISTDGKGNSYVTGWYACTSITFGTISLPGQSGGAQAVFTVKYDSQGNAVWAGRGHNPDNNPSAFAIAADKFGNAYVTGNFMNDSVSFGSVSAYNPSGSTYSVFVVKYDTLGNPVWAKGETDSQQCTGYAIVADTSGRIYVAGGFSGPHMIVSGTTLNTPSGAVTDPLFVFTMDGSGQILCASALGSGGDDIFGLCTDPAGNAYICSDFMMRTMPVGSDILHANDTLIVNGVPQYFESENIYVAKFKCTHCGSNVTLNAVTTPASICLGDSALLTLSGASAISIQPVNAVIWIDSTHAILRPDTTTQYIASGYLACGEQVQQAFTLPVFDARAVRITTNKAVLCPGEVAQMCVPNGFTYLWSTGATTSCIRSSTTGDYSVTASCNGQCLAISNQHLTAISTQPFNVTVHGDTLSYDSSPNYQWQLNGNDITGANSSVYVAHNGGTYTLQIIDTAGCPVISNPVIISGIEVLNGEGISIYPNPSNGTWELRVDNNLIGSTVEVFDVTGKLVLKSIIVKTHSVIDLSGAASGVYELRVNVQGNMVLKKLVKL